jgi:TatA/E family protein of Tat protein translocase
MFGIGFFEIIIILVLVLFIFGPKHLPELGQNVGQWISEL